MYKTRWITDRLRQAGDVFPVLMLTGARQTGKSTLLANEALFADYLHVNMDDLSVMAQAHQDPHGFVNQADHMVIDEAQRVPELFIAVKQAVDTDPRRRFVLSGSANFLLLRQIHESLAGRAGYNALRQPTWSEWHGHARPSWLNGLMDGTLPLEAETVPVPDLKQILFTGALPGIRDAAPGAAALFWESYIKTYLERDLPGISAVASTLDHQKLMRMLATTTGSLLKYSSLANDTGISASTTARYVEDLQAACLLDLVAPAPLASTASVKRNWKCYLADTGLICSLLDKMSPASIDDTLAGHLFEALICMDLLVLTELDRFSLWFVRTRRGPSHEIDFVLERDQRKVAIEVKFSDTVNWPATEHLRWYMEQEPTCRAGAIIYAGTKVMHLARNIVAVPWTMV